MVIKFSYGSNNPARGVQEIRWLWSTENRLTSFDALPSRSQLEAKTDEELAVIFQNLPRTQETTGVSFHAPILDAVLASPSFGFTDNELLKLGELRWQGHLLTYASTWLNDAVRLSYTVPEHNYDVIMENHAKGMGHYRERVDYTLGSVREALKIMES